MASSARIFHLCTVGLASFNDQLSKFFTHYIGGIDIDVPARCNGSKVYLFSGVHSKHIIYFFSLTFQSHATKPHKLHGLPPHHIIHTTLIEKKKINHPKQDLPVFCSYDVVSCTYLLVV